MKSHFFKKIISIILSLVLTICALTANVYSNEVLTEAEIVENSLSSVMFDVFYCNRNYFYYWNTLPRKVYVFKFDGMTSYYDTAVMNAVTKWNNGLGTSMYRITSTDNSNEELQYLENGALKFIGGYSSEIRTTGVFDSSTLDSYYLGGIARVDNNGYSTYYTANGQSITVYTARRGFACVVNLSNEGLSSTLSNYINTATHEMGHLLGWAGHSNSTSDVMYSQPTSITSLSYRDIGHISQVYD